MNPQAHALLILGQSQMFGIELASIPSPKEVIKKPHSRSSFPTQDTRCHMFHSCSFQRLNLCHPGQRRSCEVAEQNYKWAFLAVTNNVPARSAMGSFRPTSLLPDFPTIGQLVPCKAHRGRYHLPRYSLPQVHLLPHRPQPTA